MLKFEKVPPEAVMMVNKMSHKSMKGILLNMSDEEMKDDTPWLDRVPPGGRVAWIYWNLHRLRIGSKRL